MKTFLTLLTAAYFSIFFSTPTPAATYNVFFDSFNSNALDNDTGSTLVSLSQLPSLNVSGTITTDGTIGTLSAANITSWSFTVTDFNSVQTFDSNGTAGAVTLEGAGFLTASATQLLTNLTGSGDFIRFGNNVFVPNGTSFFQISSFNFLTVQSFVPVLPFGFSGSFGNKTLPTNANNQVVLGATAAPPNVIPLPPAMALSLAGLALLAGFKRRART